MWAKVDAYHLIKELMSVDGNRLTIGTKRWDMDKLGNIYLLAREKRVMPWPWPYVMY